MGRKKIVAGKLRLVAKDIMAFLGKEEFMKLKEEIAGYRRSVGLKDHYRNFSVTISFVSHPEFVVFGGMKWDSSGVVDCSDAGQFGEEMAEVAKKVRQVLELFRKNHPDAKIVKYPR